MLEEEDIWFERIGKVEVLVGKLCYKVVEREKCFGCRNCLGKYIFVVLILKF